VRATINSDDPAYLPGYLSENLLAVQRAVDLSRDEVVEVAQNALSVSWLSAEDREGYVDALEAFAAG
jgi:adenosine deaminase